MSAPALTTANEPILFAIAARIADPVDRQRMEDGLRELFDAIEARDDILAATRVELRELQRATGLAA